MPVVSKDSLISHALAMYGVVGDRANGDEGELLREYDRRLRETLEQTIASSKHGEPVTRKDIMLAGLVQGTTTTEGQLTVMGLTKWAHCGFPSIQMGHKYAAALMSSVATDEATAMAREPFPAFVIELPDKLLEIDDPHHKGQLLPLRRVLVTKYNHPRSPEEKVWGYVGFTEPGISVYRYAQKTIELSPPVPTIDDEERSKDLFDFEMNDRDVRILLLLGRLIVNTCLAMSDPTQIRAIGQSHANWEKHQGAARSSPEPVVRVFQVGRPIKHDFREAVREYVTGQRRKLSVQVLVRGHYRTQHFGPKNASTKLIWLEPFWRGPDDAPIPIRPHIKG